MMPSNCSCNTSTIAVSRPTFFIIPASADAPLLDPWYSAEIRDRRCLGVQYLCDFWQHFATAEQQLQVQHKRWQSSDRFYIFIFLLFLFLIFILLYSYIFIFLYFYIFIFLYLYIFIFSFFCIFIFLYFYISTPLYIYIFMILIS